MFLVGVLADVSRDVCLCESGCLEDSCCVCVLCRSPSLEEVIHSKGLSVGLSHTHKHTH